MKNKYNVKNVRTGNVVTLYGFDSKESANNVKEAYEKHDGEPYIVIGGEHDDNNDKSENEE